MASCRGAVALCRIAAKNRQNKGEGGDGLLGLIFGLADTGHGLLLEK